MALLSESRLNPPWRWMLAGMLLLVLVVPAPAEPRTITWDDLLPRQQVRFDDPFEKLPPEQLSDLSMIVRIRGLIAAGKAAADEPIAQREKMLVKKLTDGGLDVDWLLSQRERVADMRRKRTQAVDAGLAGEEIRLPGYMLPLHLKEQKVTEFLLVPWVGACIHTPPPPPNQMIHVAAPGGVESHGRFSPIWIAGRIELKPAEYELFLIDGKRNIPVAYTLTTDRISDYSAGDSDVLAKVVAPPANPNHSWWQNLQTRVSILFTQTMTGIRDRQSSGPLWIGLLIAFAYGVVHTLGPGHGKAVVASYFVGEGGSFGRGVRMGVQIAVFHVLSAIVVVWLTDFAVRQATGSGASDFRVVRMVSYGGIAVIGAFLLWRAVRSLRHRHSDHDHDKDGGKEQEHHHHRHECSACRYMDAQPRGGAGWLALAVGAVPCTGALLVLLFGLANDLVGPAILMVAAISAGMALAMSGIGLVAIFSRNLLDRRFGANDAGRRWLANSARVAGATLVLMIGLGLFGWAWASDFRVPVAALSTGERNPALKSTSPE